MAKIKSVSKLQTTQESVESFESATVRRFDGHIGQAATKGRLATQHLIATGKEPPARGGGTSGLEAVIGADDRTRILETESHPWRMICALAIRSPQGLKRGTGWFAGPRTVITAGHCVYDKKEYGGWVNDVVVSPGQNGDVRPFGSSIGTTFSSIDQWVEREDPDFDIGAIHLGEAIGDRVGWFSVASLSAEQLEDSFVNVCGYPSDRGDGEQQWFHSNRVRRLSEHRAFYDIDTTRGQSGSPVWLHERKDSPPTIVGIHAYGSRKTPPESGLVANSATRIIPSVFDVIAQWVKRDNERK